jgi:hypothetical protein
VKQLAIWSMLVFVVGCGVTTVCTLIGCDSGLTVRVTNAPDGPLSVVAVVPPSQAQFTATCPLATGCNSVFFSDFTPERVDLTITTTDGTRQVEVTPTYTTSQPNGPHCAPTCRNATVNIAWQ